MDIKGKSALITGAASGFGRELAIALAERGAAGLILLDIDQPGLAETAERVAALGGRPILRRTDVADLQDLVAGFAEAAGHGYDLCFNNAGIVAGLPEYPDTDPARIDLQVRINLTAVLVGVELAIAHLRGRGGGVIVNTGSTGATWGNLADAPYRATKAAIFHLTECCRSLGASDNIRVCAFHPGGTKTPILGKMYGGQPEPPWVIERRSHFRMLEVREVIDPVIAMVEDDARIENLIIRNPPVE